MKLTNSPSCPLSFIASGLSLGAITTQYHQRTAIKEPERQWYQLILFFTFDFLSSLLSFSKYHHYCLPYTRPRIPKDVVPYQGPYFVVKGGKVIKKKKHLLFLSRAHYLKQLDLHSSVMSYRRLDPSSWETIRYQGRQTGCPVWFIASGFRLWVKKLVSRRECNPSHNHSPPVWKSCSQQRENHITEKPGASFCSYPLINNEMRCYRTWQQRTQITKRN